MQSPSFTPLIQGKKNRKLSLRNRSAGFSLLELLVVMSLLALLATASIPSVSSIMKGRALSNAGDSAWEAVSAARQQAISLQANVALVLTNGRSSDPNKSDAFILVAASSSQSGGTTVWNWRPLTRWLKMPVGIAVAPESSSYLNSLQGTPAVAAYSGITAAMPKLEGDSIADYSYVVFRPDGTVDSASSNPVLGFRRLRPTALTDESALVLSPDSGRARLVRL